MKASDNNTIKRKRLQTGASTSPLWLCWVSHIQVTVTSRYRWHDSPPVITSVLLSVRQRRTQTHTPRPDPNTFNQKQRQNALPFEWFAASPPLSLWGAPRKTPPTCCHVGNKGASLILMFDTLSEAPLFAYIVRPLSRNGGVGPAPSLRHQGRKNRKDWISLDWIKPTIVLEVLFVVCIHIMARRIGCLAGQGTSRSPGFWYSPDGE